MQARQRVQSQGEALSLATLVEMAQTTVHVAVAVEKEAQRE